MPLSDALSFAFHLPPQARHNHSNQCAAPALASCPVLVVPSFQLLALALLALALGRVPPITAVCLGSSRALCSLPIASSFPLTPPDLPGSQAPKVPGSLPPVQLLFFCSPSSTGNPASLHLFLPHLPTSRPTDRISPPRIPLLQHAKPVWEGQIIPRTFFFLSPPALVAVACAIVT